MNQWHLGKAGDSLWPDAICEGPVIIARVLGDGYPIGRGWSAESEARAKLIAQAPALLALLDECESAMAEVCDCGECDGCALTERVRQAMAAARGESEVQS